MPQASNTMDDVYDLISVYAGITTLVGTRIFPNVAPQNAPLPYITYELVGSQPNYCCDGGPNAGDTDTVQVNIFAATKHDAAEGANQIILALNEVTTGSGTQEFLLEDDAGGGAVSDNNADDRIHWRFLTFSGITK